MYVRWLEALHGSEETSQAGEQSLVLADLLVGLGCEKSLEIGRIRELDLAQPACIDRARQIKAM